MLAWGCTNALATLSLSAEMPSISTVMRHESAGGRVAARVPVLIGVRLRLKRVLEQLRNQGIRDRYAVCCELDTENALKRSLRVTSAQHDRGVQDGNESARSTGYTSPDRLSALLTTPFPP